MKKQRSYRIRGARSSTAHQKSSFLKKAAELKDHPEYLLPECDDTSFFGPFTKLKKQLDLVHRFSDNLEKVKKFMKKGDPIARAYAAMIKVHHDGSIGDFAVYRTPWGDELKLLKRGNIPNEKLVGVQYYDDSRTRLIAFRDIVIKRGLTLYSFKDRMVCYSMKRAFESPPEEFISFALSKVDIKLKRDSCCHHLNRERIEAGKESSSYLEIQWKTAERKIYICRNCAGEETSTFINITNYFASSKHKAHFDVHYNYHMECRSKEEGCACRDFVQNSEKLKDKYLGGHLSDMGYIKATEEQIMEDIMKSSRTLYISKSVCYGQDLSAFLASLNLDETARKAMEVALLKQKGPLAISDQSPGQLLKEMWEDVGLTVLQEFTGDEELAKKVYDEHKVEETSPLRIIRAALDYTRHEKVLMSLPLYDTLPPKANFANSIARTYKISGKDAAVRELASKKTEATAALAYAFYLSFGVAEKMAWKFSKEQTDYGIFLKEFVDRLLKGEGDEYHETLKTLNQAAGSTEGFERKDT